MLRSLLFVLAGLTGLAIVIGLGGILFRGKEYTIEELYAETLTRTIQPEQLKLGAIVMNEGGERTAVSNFVEVMRSDVETFEPAINRIRANWHPGDTIMLIELEQFAGDYFRRYLAKTIDEVTGETFRDDQEAQYRWAWKQSDALHPQYREFKASIYSEIDERFESFFASGQKSLIPFNEVRWSGVRVDGIPPLDSPATVSANEATFLADDDVVFGVEVGGEARAYPKQILAWHELVRDEIGGVAISGVYCTLCESMIFYRSRLNGTHHEFGTSGFLYRSNKLMYDKGTFSMWSTYDGRPVVGPLVESDIRLEREPVVTTKWAQWKKLHPNTSVLSRRTGFRRDYREGAAYQDYLATDRLMFSVPTLDSRLKNKAEVFVVDGGDVDRSKTGVSPTPIAYSVEFLRKNPVYLPDHSETPLVVLTDSTGANRAYQTQGVIFSKLDGDTSVIDDQGRKWTVTEHQLILNKEPGILENDQQTLDANELIRIPAHRSFWFGWYAAHPDTTLIM